MATPARLDIKMDSDEKDIIVRAAALAGTTMAAFVRAAAKEKAAELLNREAQMVMTSRDFDAFAQALTGGFQPNQALINAMNDGRKKRGT